MRAESCGSSAGDVPSPLRLGILAEQLRIALLLLAGATIQARDQTALDQPGQRGVHLVEPLEGVDALAALLELTRRLWRRAASART